MGEFLRKAEMRLPDGSIKAKVIFNPESGRAQKEPRLLTKLLTCLQKQEMIPEVHIFQPGDNLGALTAAAVNQDFDLVIVSGGDGTVAGAAGGLVNTTLSLGIIPTGTRNNQALALGIPLNDLDAAVHALRAGHIRKIDTALMHCGASTRSLVEVGSLGLTSALFPPTDDIQHGEIARIGEFLRILLEHPLTRVEAEIDGGETHIEMDTHTVLITNMPYSGANWRLGEGVSYDDGLLDIFFFPEMNKFELIDTVLRINAGEVGDERVWHYQVSSARFHCHQPMPVMVDGVILDSCELFVEVQPRSLQVISPHAA
jgi:diacylglycerol kinase (ATP)